MWLDDNFKAGALGKVDHDVQKEFMTLAKAKNLEELNSISENGVDDQVSPRQRATTWCLVRDLMVGSLG